MFCFEYFCVSLGPLSIRSHSSQTWVHAALWPGSSRSRCPNCKLPNHFGKWTTKSSQCYMESQILWRCRQWGGSCTKWIVQPNVGPFYLNKRNIQGCRGSLRLADGFIPDHLHDVVAHFERRTFHDQSGNSKSSLLELLLHITMIGWHAFVLVVHVSLLLL